MILSSAPALVAACTAVFGLHSSSRTVSSYSYFAFGSALRSRTARSAELRPPMPLAATPPVSGPMKATLTFSLAAAGRASDAASSAAASAIAARCLVMRFPSLRPSGGLGPHVRAAAGGEQELGQCRRAGSMLQQQ